MALRKAPKEISYEIEDFCDVKQQSEKDWRIRIEEFDQKQKKNFVMFMNQMIIIK